MGLDLVTGGAGFVGSHLVDRLVAQGRRVRVLDGLVDRPTDPADRLRDTIRRWRDEPRVGFVHAALADAHAIRDALVDVERVFHLAGYTGARRAEVEPVDVVEANTVGTAILLREMGRSEVRELVFTSSAAVYGGADRPLREDHPTRPVSVYGATKVGAEALVQAWVAAGWGSAAILRLATVYGPRQRPDMAVRRLLGAIAADRPVPVFGDGSLVRDHLFVDDAVHALIAAAEARRLLVLNVGTGVGTSLLGLVDALREVTGRRGSIELIPEQPGDPHAVVLDPTLAAAELGWSADIELADGLARTWRRHRGAHR